MTFQERFSKNSQINHVINNILNELCPFLEEQARDISDMTAIGKALGSGKDIHSLLNQILSMARRFTRADGGTLYLVDHTRTLLEFQVIQNASLNLFKEGAKIDLPYVRLYHEDKTPNLSTVSSFVYHTGEIVNIEDVYQTKKFNFKGTIVFDEQLKYRSRSMVVIPMRNHEDEIIGILQLINAIDPKTDTVQPFCFEDQEKAAALASQAAILLTQQMLILEMSELFEAFIRAIAVSIDEKSKHTGGHIQRVTELSLMIADMINNDNTLFADENLSDDQLDELRIAALMHDTGKITTPDHIIGKSTKLETIFDRIELIKLRVSLFQLYNQLQAEQQKLSFFDTAIYKDAFARIDKDCQTRNAALDQDLKTLSFVNATKTPLKSPIKETFETIKQKSQTINNTEVPFLTADEIEHLSIHKGTLTAKEREVINSHAFVTEKILSALPWPKKLDKIPTIAGAHHEKLDGSGYPLHLQADSLNIQARILAVADIFEALSAKDRPYKKPMTLGQTITVLKKMGGDNQIDNDIVHLFIQTNTHLKYAQKHLSDSQIDV